MEITFAGRQDCGEILSMIRALARYEKMEDQVIATEEGLESWLFDRGKAEVLLGREKGKTIGFALFFHNFSTFLGRAGLYLEDLYVLPEYRGLGYGKRFLARLAALAQERECGRVEWWCLDWNHSSIGFYQSLGAEAMEEWTTYRLTGPALSALAEADQPR